MKLSNALAVGSVGLSLLVAVAAFAQGCGSTSSGTPAGQPSTDSGPSMTAEDAGSQVGIVPPMSSGSKTTGTTPKNFALHTLQLGDIDPTTGMMSANAWESLGYNVDGKITTATSTDVCSRVSGAPVSVQVDGNGGIDNSFSANLLPLVETATGSGGLDQTLDTSINSGSFTIMFDLVGLTDDPMQTNTGLTGQLFAGGKFAEPDGAAAMPAWTPADNWPVLGTLLNNPMSVASGSKIQFSDSFVIGGTWVSGSPVAMLSIQLSISGQMLTLNVHQAVVTMQHTMPTHMANGTIAGVVRTSELLTSLATIAGHISSSLCPGSPLFASIGGQIQEDSDILDDGTNAPGMPCDAISIGLGFTADEIGLPKDVAPVGTPGPNPCGDGG